MAPQIKKQRKTEKPILIKCGNHYINPKDINRITKVKTRSDDNKSLYVVEFLSNPNPQHTCWVKGDDIISLLEQFEIITSDEK